MHLELSLWRRFCPIEILSLLLINKRVHLRENVQRSDPKRGVVWLSCTKMVLPEEYHCIHKAVSNVIRTDMYPVSQ